MPSFESYGLDGYQIDAVNRMKNGCILCGGVGSGKSRTSLAYYITGNANAQDVNLRLPPVAVGQK